MKGESSSRQELPNDIVSEILLNLPVKTLTKLKCVCKSWCSLISSHHFHQHHFTRSQSKPPLLLTIRDDADGLQYEDPFFKLHLSVYNNTATKLLNSFSKTQPGIEFPHPSGETIPTLSCHGLVCFGSETLRTLVCNPSTQELIALPPVKEPAYCMGFGYATSTREFKVVSFFHSYRHVFTLGSFGWREGMHPPYRVRRGCAPFINGALHLLPRTFLLGSDDYISAFNIDTEEYTKISVPDTCCAEAWPHLIELGGSLCLILDFLMMNGQLVLWFLKDYINIEWVNTYTIDLSRVHLPFVWGRISARPVGIMEDGSILLNLSKVELWCNDVCMNISEVELWCYDVEYKRLTRKIGNYIDFSSTFFVESFFSLMGR